MEFTAKIESISDLLAELPTLDIFIEKDLKDGKTEGTVGRLSWRLTK